MANTRDYGKFQRPSFVDGGDVNQAVSNLKQMLADTGVDKPTKAALERKQTAATTNSATSSNGDPYGWESNTPKFDKDGLPMHRVMETPYGRIPYAKGGVVKKKEIQMTVYTKGEAPRNADYAKGGGCFNSRSRFMKAPDPFREDIQRSDYDKAGKGGEMSKLEGETKKLKAVKPRG